MLQIDVLGPVRVRRDGTEIDLGTPRQRQIVAALALAGERGLPTDALVDQVWGQDAPATVTGTLQSYVGQLRRALEPERGPRSPATVLVTAHGGYALRIGERDDLALAGALSRARELLRVVPDPLRPLVPAGGEGAVSEAITLVETALGQWRGTPYAELGGVAVPERARLTDLRTAALEARAVGLLALGRHDEVAAEIERMTHDHPLHERWWTLAAVSLARAGRQADALATLQRLRSVLDDELGVEPSAPVRDLQTAILRQDPSVTWSRPAPVPVPVADDLPTAAPPAPPWSLAGRRDELARLTDGLLAAEAGRPGAAWITGEAGIGKSRLVQELARVAHERGFTVVTAACGHVGAPPLWPWHQTLGALRSTAPAGDPDDFATRDEVASAVRSTARRTAVLVVLEDVHEADPASLRVLQHLLATLTGERLLVVATRRSGAGEEDALRELATSVARLGGARVDLTGLDAEDAAELVGQVPGELGTPATELAARAGGNPYFLLELARSGGRVSGSLADVVASRVAGLPEETARVLTTAAVAGESVDTGLLAAALAIEPAALAARLRPAVGAGMLLQSGRPRDLVFAHAVLRDVVLARTDPAQRRELHARLALVLDGTGLRRVEQRAELAEHWEAAGPARAGAAWRSVLRAAETAAHDRAHHEAADLLTRAVRLQEADPAADERERYALLMLLVDAQRWSGQWSALGRTVDLAVLAAERAGDHELAARAAMATLEGAIWQVRTFGVVHAPLVAALERALARLDADGGPVGLRARGRVALATELYYAVDTERVDALVAEALALADGSEDPRLLSIVLPGAFSARWRADTMGWRRDVADRALVVATELGDARAQAVARTLVVCAAMEGGDLATAQALLRPALDLARHLGLITAEAVLLGVAVPLAAMAGHDDQARSDLAAAAELARTSRLPNFDRALVGTTALAAMWAADTATLTELGQRLGEITDDGVSMEHVAPWLLLRTGNAELARALFPSPAVDLSPHSYTFLANACLACELGLGLDLPELARAGYAAAASYAGRMASGGSAMAIGPVDGFLALGAAAAGDLDAARRHADAGAALARAWHLPRYDAWLAGVRTVHGF